MKTVVTWGCVVGVVVFLTGWAIKRSYDNDWVATDHRNTDAQMRAVVLETPQSSAGNAEVKETAPPDYKSIVSTVPKP